MKYIGAHVSVDGGVSNAPLRAAELNMKAFALFTRNPSRWKSAPISDKEAERFRTNCIEAGYGPEVILPHDSFHRCAQLGLNMLNFHPGSHLNLITDKECLQTIADSINMALDKTEGITAVIESTAGQGSNLGFRFEQLAEIIDMIEDKTRIGVCVDTCHTFAAGYDLATPEGYDRTWDDFEKTIGFRYLKGMHLNDSKKGLGSRVDRHESIGKGALGEEFFKMLMADSRMNGMPLILETPNEEIWGSEVEYLYSLHGAL